MEKIDLNKIQKHIEKSKAEKEGKLVALGESTGIPVSGDKFLTNLMQGIQTGQNTPAVTQVKAVNQATMVKDGDRASVDAGLVEQVNSTPKAVVNIPAYNGQPPANQYGQPPANQQLNQHGQPVDQYGNPVNYGPPAQASNADRGLYAEMERKMQEMRGIQTVGAPMNQPNQPQQLAEGQVMQPVNVQPNVLNEQIVNTVTTVFKEMGSTVLQEAMKDTIVETYKAERVGIALRENKDFIKKIVLETISELQQKNKKRKPQAASS